MTLQSDDARLVEALKATAARIDEVHFEALSHGIGLGEVRPKKVGAASMRPTAELRGQGRTATPPVPLRGAVTRKVQAMIAPQPQASSRWAGGQRLFLAHCLDLVVIAATILLAAMIASQVLHPTRGKSFQVIGAKMLSGSFLATLGVLDAFLLLYLIFAVYWLFFRVIAGMTLGESLVRGRQAGLAKGVQGVKRR